MKATATLLGAAVLSLAMAVPAFAIEDGIVETSSMTPNDDFTHAVSERAITNTSEDPIDIAPRDLRTADYPIMTVTEITAGSFGSGIWAVGTLAAGATAMITYTGDANPTTTVPEATTTTDADEELPLTGSNDGLTVIAILGFALIGLGTALLRSARN